MHNIEQSDDFKKAYRKLRKRDKVIFEQISQKMDELAADPSRFKHLRNVLAGFCRLHFGSYVLMYRVESETVFLVSIDHHDDAY